MPAFYQVTGQGDVFYLSQQDRIDRDQAIFGDATFDITDKLKMSAGLRYFWVDNTLFGFFGFNNNGYSSNGEASCFAPSTNATNRPCINTDKRVTDSGETHRVNLTYQIDPDAMVYATYSTGYRPGGNNRIASAPAFTPDKLTNYELGWKTTWDQNRFRFNGAIFYEDWTKLQLGIQGQSGITSILNVGDAEVKGIEGELSWLATEGLTLSVSGTYVDAKTTTRFCESTVTLKVTSTCTDEFLVAPSGTKLPVTPNVKANASARYSFKAGDLDSYVQLAAFHQSSTTFGLEAIHNEHVGDTPQFSTLDFSAGIGKKNWHLDAYIQNLTDERGELGKFSQCNDFEFYCNDHARVYPIKPQIFGIKFGQNF